LTIHRVYIIVPIKTKTTFLPFFQHFSIHYYASTRCRRRAFPAMMSG
jgi:hypothetical protein